MNIKCEDNWRKNGQVTREPPSRDCYESKFAFITFVNFLTLSNQTYEQKRT